MKRSLPVLFVLAAMMIMLIAPVTAQDGIVFGVVLVGPENDRGWSQSHVEGGQYVLDNVEGSEMLIFESLNPADTPEATLMDVVTDMVDSGAELIFTTSDSFEEDTNVVAAEFPDVTFVNITGSNAINSASIVEGEHALEHDLSESAPMNVGNFNGLMEAPRMLAGCAAALTTETGNIGYLGALINPETRRLVVAADLGARYCYENYRGGDPDELTFTVTWIGFWFNIPGVTLDPTEVSNEFFNSGADVIISGIDTTEAITVAGQRTAEGERVFAVPYGNANGCSEAPDACLGVAFYNWGPAYLDVVNRVMDGTWEQEWVLLDPVWDEISEEGYYTGADTSVIGYLHGGGVSDEVKAQLDEFAAEIAAFEAEDTAGEAIFLWEGPMALQDGTVLAEEGEFVDQLDIWFLPQLTDDIIGASE